MKRKVFSFGKNYLLGLTALALLGVSTACSSSSLAQEILTLIGTDLNSVLNAFVQPQDPALAGGGRDQSLQFGDVLEGGNGDDILVGGLGVDVLFGNGGNDIIIGGTEDFNPQNRDRAFGGTGNDLFAWAPGDGSDFFDGGEGNADVVAFGFLGETGPDGDTVFGVQTDQNFDGIETNPDTGLPILDVTSSPGFCEVLDSSTNEADLQALNLNHLVRFSIRGIRNAFEAGEQTTDNGVRVTLHLRNVEFLVCTSRDGGAIEVLDLTTAPPTPAQLSDLPSNIQDVIR